jgi:signal transduction histidine kinase
LNYTPIRAVPGKIETALLEHNDKVFEVFSYPVNNAEGLVSGTVEVAMDVTDRETARKYAEAQREQMINAEKMISLGILVAEAAHEINNPTNFIKINSSIIKQVWECILPILNEYFEINRDYVIAGIPSGHIGETMNDLINGVDDGTERIISIIESLKDFSRNKPPDMSGSFNINFAVKKSIAFLTGLIKKSTNRFNTYYASNLPDVRGDIKRIEQVIMNVLQNACHSLPDKNKSICLKTFMENNKIIILVEDEGIGIPPDNLGRVTDPFFTTKDKNGGTGLGLSISKNIIRDHKGDMIISSDAQNGTSVKIVLPSAIQV